MLDGGFFLLDNGTLAERANTVSEEGLTLALKSSHYLFSASFGLDHRAMRTLHAVLDTGAGPNLIRSDVLPIGCRQNLVTSAHLPRLGDANGRPLQLQGVVILRLRLGNSHFRVPFVVATRLAASMIIGTDFLDRNVRAIR